MTDETQTLEARTPDRTARVIRRIIAAGQLRYWLIGSWGLALATVVPWRLALGWFAVTVITGLARTMVDRRPDSGASVKLIVATVSCVAWAGAPLLSYLQGASHGLTLAVALLIAGYVLVFTQMRAAPREALIVSAPYTLVFAFMVLDLWGQASFWTLVALGPPLALALLIKVVITEIKDDQLEAVNARQAQLIHELEQARDSASAASEAKSNFLGVISHELRTPMNGVLGAAQLLEQQNFVSIIRRSGDSLLALLNDILDLTKIEANRMEIAACDTRLEELAERVVGPFRAQAEAKGLDFGFAMTGDQPAVICCDPLRVAQIGHNLLSNAVKFTTTGQVALTIDGRRLDDGRCRLTFSVADSGSGISPTDLNRLFEPFTQVDASSTRRFGGTGLGLSICRRLAHLMGGEIAVQSVVDQGSVFSLTFEVEVAVWADQGANDTIVEAPAEQLPLRVLVVEDHPVNRMVLEAWLLSMGHSCIMAENGQIGLDQAGLMPFDLIVMDVNMPVMDGLTATAEIRRRDGPNRTTPIAVLSASARPEDHALGFAAGADSYVDKPVDFATLAQVIAAVPGGRPALRALAA
jgi:signal transduction histidine kinase/ActR/RegA family two-component response regulator